MSPTKPRGAFNIPDRFRSGLFLIAGVSDDAFDELASALDRSPEFTNAKELAAWVAPEAKSIPAPDVPQVMEALTSLYRVRTSLGESAERVAKDVVSAMQAEDASGRVTDSRSTVARLSRLLDSKALNVLDTKVKELKTEYEHSLCDLRIFTDARPVFGNNVADAPSTMLLVHTLRLGYHDAHETRHREIYISLDAQDLISLRELIERAETKAKTLKSRFESAGIKLVD